MMKMLAFPGRPVSQVDSILYTLAVLLGLAIVGMNYLKVMQPEARPEPYPVSAEAAR